MSWCTTRGCGDGGVYCAWCNTIAVRAGVVLGPASAVGAVSLPPPLPDPPLDRYKSTPERLYATQLALAQQAGVIKRWWYEPQKGLYLAPRQTYTPDFLLEYPDPTRRLEFHEVKGATLYSKDLQKPKQAAAMYPCYVFVVAQWKDHGWQYTRIPAL